MAAKFIATGIKRVNLRKLLEVQDKNKFVQCFASASGVSRVPCATGNTIRKTELKNISGSRLYVIQASDASIEAEANVAVMEETEYDKLYKSIDVECRGVDPAVLRSYAKFIATSANHLQIKLEKVEFPRYHLARWTLLKSVHIYGKHKVQYEVRTYFLIMKFLQLTSSTADTFLEYIQRNLPEGVSMKVTKEELLPLPPYVKGSDAVAPTRTS